MPGVSSKAVPPPDNTAQIDIQEADSSPRRSQPITEQGRETGRAGLTASSSRTGCGTLRHKGLPLRRKVFHPAGWDNNGGTAGGGETMRIPISEIKINPGRREVLSKRVSELAKSIAEVGLSPVVWV